MKIIAETPAEERLLARINVLSHNMATQGNRATNFPVWTVLDRGKEGADYGAVMFFSQAAAETHLVTDPHHYDDPSLYIRSAHNNPEIKDVVHLLLLAGNNPINDNHYGRLR